jgi:hypothetical protein
LTELHLISSFPFRLSAECLLLRDSFLSASGLPVFFLAFKLPSYGLLPPRGLIVLLHHLQLPTGCVSFWDSLLSRASLVWFGRIVLPPSPRGSSSGATPTCSFRAQIFVPAPAHSRFWPSVRPPRRTQSIYESFKKCKQNSFPIQPFKRKRFQLQRFTVSDFSSSPRFFALFSRRNFAPDALFNRSLPGVRLNFSEDFAFLFAEDAL